jgi:hypothetical protein
MTEQFGRSINVDIPKGLLESDLFSEHLEGLAFAIALDARRFWEAEAGRVLSTSREEYQNAIGMVQTGKYEVTVQLMGKDSGRGSGFAVDVELGRKAHSMVPGFLKSASIKKKRIPRAIAEHLRRMTGQAPATRWMVIPINATGRPPGPGGKVVNPTFRMFSNKQPSSMWRHPGLQGVHIADTVHKELMENIIDKHVEGMIDKVIAGL